jgi:hypothetical protein
LVLLVAIVLTEWRLDRAGYGQVITVRVDPDVGWMVEPNQEGFSRLGVPVKINSAGFRDEEWGELGDQSEGPIRIAVVGASVTYAGGVLEEERWTEVLEDALQEVFAGFTPAREVLVMNFAVAGHAFDQMEQVYQHHVRPWKPDLCLVALADNTMRPPQLREESGWLRRIVRHSAIYDYGCKRIPGIRRPGIAPPRTPEEQAANDRRHMMSRTPFVAENRDLFDTMCLRLAEMEADMRSMGGRLALVPLPHLHCILNPGNPRMGLELATSPATKDILSLDAFQDFVEVYDGIVQTLVESGISPGMVMRYWETKPLRMTKLVGDRVLHRVDDRYHMPARGHALLATVVREDLLEKGLLNSHVSAPGAPDSDVVR